MSIKAGLVGLPNVGKSTLFNALTKSSVPAENYPFCTIDPHIAITETPDERLMTLKNIYKSEKIIPSTVTFVDIAGLVKGAASGEGLGNQFLSHIRDVHLIVHVLRCFEDPDIIHQGETIDPLADYQTIIDELMLSDLDSIDKRLTKLEKLIKTNNAAEKKAFEQEQIVLQHIKSAIDIQDSNAIHTLISNAPVTTIPLLSAKDFLIIANVAEQELDDASSNKHYQTLIEKFGSHRVIPVCAKLEHELSQMNSEDAKEIMDLIGLPESGLNTIIKTTYKQLGLITFFTCGPREIHAWPIKKGTRAPEAAGEIHSDLQRGFICAETFNYNDLITLGSEAKIKESGKMRKEGKEYIIQDGDIVHVRFNV